MKYETWHKTKCNRQNNNTSYSNGRESNGSESLTNVRRMTPISLNRNYPQRAISDSNSHASAPILTANGQSDEFGVVLFYFIFLFVCLFVYIVCLLAFAQGYLKSALFFLDLCFLFCFSKIYENKTHKT